MHTRRLHAVLALLLLGAAGASSAGCGSSAPGAAECNADPFSCAAGTVCGVRSCTCPTASCTTDQCTPEFACLPSVSYAVEGSSCDTALGKAACADDLACVVDQGQGVCTPYCDSQNPCAPGLSCEPRTVELGPASSYPVIYVCQVPDGGFLEIDAGGHGPQPEASIGDAIGDVAHFDVRQTDSR